MTSEDNKIKLIELFADDTRDEREAVVSKVCSMMGWDKEKGLLWYTTDNPMLGGVSPEYMVIFGRCDKLLNFIRNVEEENFAPIER
jgi:hypothetical protein